MSSINPLTRKPATARSLSSARLPTRRAALAALALGAACLGGSATLPGRGLRNTAAAHDLLPSDDVCVVAPPTPYDAASGRPLHAAREVPDGARCPVCGMYPARSRAWAAQAIFADGDAFFFDSPLSLLLYLGNVAHYTRGRSAGGIVAHYVTDTDTQAWVDARQAAYVHGSSARGPMRAGNLPAFGSHSAAERFAREKGGRVLAFAALDAPLLRSLAPGRGAGHAAHA